MEANGESRKRRKEREQSYFSCGNTLFHEKQFKATGIDDVVKKGQICEVKFPIVEVFFEDKLFKIDVFKSPHFIAVSDIKGKTILIDKAFQKVMRESGLRNLKERDRNVINTCLKEREPTLKEDPLGFYMRHVIRKEQDNFIRDDILQRFYTNTGQSVCREEELKTEEEKTKEKEE